MQFACLVRLKCQAIWLTQHLQATVYRWKSRCCFSSPLPTAIVTATEHPPTTQSTPGGLPCKVDIGLILSATREAGQANFNRVTFFYAESDVECRCFLSYGTTSFSRNCATEEECALNGYAYQGLNMWPAKYPTYWESTLWARFL